MDSLAGKVMIDFWATWCGPCRDALPHMRYIAKSSNADEFVMLSVSLDADEAAWMHAVVYDGRDWIYFSTTNGSFPNAVRALAEDADGKLWVGTEGGGLFTIEGGRIIPAKAPVKDVSCLLADHDGVLWAGTVSHGLARLAHGQWTTYSAGDGLAGDDIGYLVEDGAGNLWLGLYEGLVRVPRNRWRISPMARRKRWPAAFS